MPASSPAGVQLRSSAAALAEAERCGRAFLLFRDGDGIEQVFLFALDSVTATVGRQPSSDVLLAWDDRVSRLHARFERAREGWDLVDDGLSSNGTFINEQRLNGRCRLDDGDRLRFGTTTVTFRHPAHRTSPKHDAMPAAPAPASPAPAPAGQAAAAVSLSTNQRRVLAALCRPYRDGGSVAMPATDERIAEELVLAVGEVRGHLRVLCAKLGIAGSWQDSGSRVELVERAFATGLITEREL